MKESFIKAKYRKSSTIINKSLKDSCKSLNIKNYNNEIWITDCNKNKTDEKKYDNILFKNTKIYNKVMKSTNNEKNNSFKNKTIEEMKQNNLKKINQIKVLKIGKDLPAGLIVSLG